MKIGEARRKNNDIIVAGYNGIFAHINQDGSISGENLFPGKYIFKGDIVPAD